MSNEKEYFPPQPDEDRQGHVYRRLSQIAQDIEEILRRQAIILGCLERLEGRVE